MRSEQALMPILLSETKKPTLANTLVVVTGVFLLSILAQIAIPLPWTPVPITGQTFGVAVLSLIWGRNRAFAVVATYLSIGFLGLPVFAQGKAGFVYGPTLGYLVGMFFAAIAMGSLADRGWTTSLYRTWFAAFIGSLITFSCGVVVLSLFIPKEQLFTSGVLPFLPGDAIKTALASAIANGCRTRIGGLK